MYTFLDFAGVFEAMDCKNLIEQARGNSEGSITVNSGCFNIIPRSKKKIFFTNSLYQFFNKTDLFTCGKRKRSLRFVYKAVLSEVKVGTVAGTSSLLLAAILCIVSWYILGMDVVSASTIFPNSYLCRVWLMFVRIIFGHQCIILICPNTSRTIAINTPPVTFSFPSSSVQCVSIPLEC